MDRNDIDAAQLLRYLMGDARLSPEEKEDIRARLQEDPEWGQLMQDLQSKAPASWDTEAELEELEAKIRGGSSSERIAHLDGRSMSSRRVRRHRNVLQPFVRVAAILVFVAFSTLLAVHLWGDMPAEVLAPEEEVFVTKKGERSILQLADGTRVRLNVDSRLRLAANFSSGVREVWLEGQAYFTVAKDSARPFIVHTDPATVEVLGTAFDVSVYSGEPVVRVVVAEGKVSFRPEQALPREAVALTAREMGRLFRNGEQVMRAQADLRRYLAWMDGELVFEDASFDEVVKKLERWYDLEVERPDSTTTSGHLNASFTEQQSMNDVLTIIATAFSLSYEREGKTIMFFPVK